MGDIVFYEIQAQPDFVNSVQRFVRKKHFRSLPKQIEDLALELQQGNFSGDRIIHSDAPPYDVYKKRLPNPDVNVGQSNGYRVIYLAEHANRIIALLAIYYKKEDEELADTYIEWLIEGFFASYN